MRLIDLFHAVPLDRTALFLIAFGIAWPFALWMAIERPWPSAEERKRDRAPE